MRKKDIKREVGKQSQIINTELFKYDLNAISLIWEMDE